MERGEQEFKPPPCSVFFVEKRKRHSARNVKIKQTRDPFKQNIRRTQQRRCKDLDLSEDKLIQKHVKQMQWKAGLEMSNNCQFDRQEWIEKWFRTLDSVNKLTGDEIGEYDCTRITHMQPGSDDSSSVVIWQGNWGRNHRENVDKRNQSCFRPKKERCSNDVSNGIDCRVINQCNVDSKHTSAIADRETRNDSPSTSRSVPTKEPNSEFNMGEHFSEINEKMIVTLCCENFVDKDKVKKRWVHMHQKGMSDKYRD